MRARKERSDRPSGLSRRHATHTMVTMNQRRTLVSAAEQLAAIELFLGNRDLVPNGVAPLPAVESSGETESEPQPDIAAELPTAREKGTALAAIAAEIASCRRCGLCDSRKNPVPGEGAAGAELVFVGEAPGADEDAGGRPFVGRAGQLLTRMITAMGLDRSDVFICNMLKCRPPGNRHPAPEELEACRDYLSRQLAAIRPRVIVTLGNPATRGLLDTVTGITRLRGSWQILPGTIPAIAGTPVMPTFHPSYVLRRYTADTRRKVWQDLQSVMERLGLEPPGQDE